MTSIIDYIAQMNAELDRKEFDIRRFDELLEDLYALKDPDIIQPLLGIFRDGFAYEEAFWSVLHAIESFDTKVYFKELLSGIYSQKIGSKDWLGILLSRIANSPQHRGTFLRMLDEFTGVGVRSELYEAMLAATEDIATENMRELQDSFNILLRKH